MRRLEWDLAPAERETLTWPQAVPAGVRLTVVAPPYHAARGALPAAPDRGDVLLFDLDDPAPAAFPTLAAMVRQLCRAYPVASAVRVQPRWAHATRLIASARELGFDAVLVDGQPLAAGLTSFLAQPLDPAQDWIRWLIDRRMLPPRMRELARDILTWSPDAGSVRTLQAHLPVPARTLRNLLRQDGLPKLERWYDGARLLQADLELQRDPRVTVEEMAQRLGYADAYSYSCRAYRLFGITPGASRKLLGLQWRFDAWWRCSCRLTIRSGRNVPPQLLPSTSG